MDKPTQDLSSKETLELQGTHKTLLDSLTQPVVLQALDKCDEAQKLVYALQVRANYKSAWRWSPGAEYVYRELIRAIGLPEWEEVLVHLAKPRRGRKEECNLAARIWALKAEGKTVPEMRAIFESEQKYFSSEKIESYLKTRRKKSTI